MNNEVTMFNRTYIQEQVYNGNVFGDKYFFDINTDTSKNSSSEVADSPVDASMGATLRDKRVINMRTVGLTGKFTGRCSNNPTESFNVTENRIGTIIDYYEDALAKQKIYTVCKKGALYENMMLNKVNLKFGDGYSTVEISLSFIEVNIVEVDYYDTSSVIIEEETADEQWIRENGYEVRRFISPKLRVERKESDAYPGLVTPYAIVENTNEGFKYYWKTGIGGTITSKVETANPYLVVTIKGEINYGDNEVYTINHAYNSRNDTSKGHQFTTIPKGSVLVLTPGMDPGYSNRISSKGINYANVKVTAYFVAPAIPGKVAYDIETLAPYVIRDSYETSIDKEYFPDPEE